MKGPCEVHSSIAFKGCVIPCPAAREFHATLLMTSELKVTQKLPLAYISALMNCSNILPCLKLIFQQTRAQKVNFYALFIASFVHRERFMQYLSKVYSST